MTQARGFLSYQHDDDKAEGGRICQLVRDISEQYELLTAERIELFLDRDHIAWGEEWRSRIGESLSSVAFFIPILTPRYFLSVECRRELQIFARRADRIGVRDLILPILYVDVPALSNESSEDDLINLVRTFQWEDWTQLRFAARDSGEYRSAVSRLARRLKDANIAAESLRPESVPPAPLSPDDDDNEAGYVDKIAAAEETMPQWVETIVAVAKEIEHVSDSMQAANLRIRAAGESSAYAVRLTEARKLAADLEGPVVRIEALINNYSTQLNTVDDGIRTIIEMAPDEIDRRPESRTVVCEFFASMSDLAISAREGFGSAESMVRTVSDLEGSTRLLRPTMRRLRKALTIMIESREVTNEWADLIRRSPVDCPQELGTATS